MKVTSDSATRLAADSRALPRYVPGLDGIRAVGMCTMLAYHAELDWAKGAFLALSQFFTLSGFLITSILLRQADRNTLSLGQFWARRYRRLMPASFAALALVVVFGATAANPVQLAALPGEITAAVFQVVNWYFIATESSYFEIFAAPSPVQHFWSLAVEEQFYLVMPVALVLILRRGRSLGFTGGILVASALLSTGWMIHLYEQGASLDRLYYGSDTRAAETLVGATLAVVLHKYPLQPTPKSRLVFGVVGTLSFAVSLWGFAFLPLADGPIWRGGFLVFSLITAGLITSVLVGSGPAAWLLGQRWLSAIGRITYGLYLYHWPIYLFLTPERTGFGPGELLAARLGVTFAAATLSYHFLEMPIRDGATFGVRGRFVPWMLPTAGVLIIASAFAVAQREVVSTDPLIAAQTSMPVQEATAAQVLEVLVIHDAYSAALAGEILEVAERSSSLKASSARPFGCSKVVQGADGPICANWLTEWKGLVDEFAPDVVLFHVTDWDAKAIRAVAPPGLKGDALTDWVVTVLGNGLSLLGVHGATVVWDSVVDDDFAVRARRTRSPFQLAMGRLVGTRRNLRSVQKLLRTGDTEPGTIDYRAPRTDELLEELALYARAPQRGATRVLVVGDSVARTMGYGLERWAEDSGSAMVWTTATLGCGLLNHGFVREMQFRPGPSPKRCRDVEAGWRAQVDQFDPEVVVVFSSIWDLQERRLDGWDDYLRPGDPVFDAHLLGQYRQAVEILSSRGATVIWVQGPCAKPPKRPGANPIGAGPYGTDRLLHVNQSLLPRLPQEYPGTVALLDLFPVLCPDGEFVGGIDGIEHIRPDGVHFSHEGAIWIAASQGPTILEIDARLRAARPEPAAGGGNR